jgi:hypothetical protein
VERLAISFGIDGDRRDALLAAAADDARGDLASIGNEDLTERRQAASS